MLPDMKSVWPVIIRCDLDRKPYAITNILYKLVSGPPIALSDAMRKDQFRIRVDTAPQPKISAFGL